jgi:para-nitrobenzyl esterase
MTREATVRRIVCLLAMWCTIYARPASADFLRTSADSGALVGLASRDGLVASFKGIPYAEPPVGPLRWRPPKPATPWQGTREAMSFGPRCPQPSPQPGAFYQREFFQSVEPENEDCLYLNVWTAARAGDAPRPVMVLLHTSGGFDGSTAIDAGRRTDQEDERARKAGRSAAGD